MLTPGGSITAHTVESAGARQRERLFEMVAIR
jgi:hypothetical protein